MKPPYTDTTLRDYAYGIVKASIQLKETLLQGDQLDSLVIMAKGIAKAFRMGHKLLLCGNGGSAADAQHLAAEFLVRLRSHVERPALAAIPLTMDTVAMTACSNDYGFEQMFERMVHALGRPGDIILGISTSGRSPNVIRALQTAQSASMITYGFLAGENGGPAAQFCDEVFIVPGQETGRIQEAHITAGHALVEMVEELLLEYAPLSVACSASILREQYEA